MVQVWNGCVATTTRPFLFFATLLPSVLQIGPPVAFPAIRLAAVELPEAGGRKRFVPVEIVGVGQSIDHARRLGARVIGKVQHFGFQRHRRHRRAELELSVMR